MQDGTKVAVEDMGDKHLMRAYRMVCRSILPDTYWAATFKDEIKRRGLQQHPMARLTKDEAANLNAMHGAEFSAWQGEHDY